MKVVINNLLRTPTQYLVAATTAIRIVGKARQSRGQMGKRGVPL